MFDDEIYDDIEESPDELDSEGSVRYVEVEYECENCNYRWKKQVKAYISEENRHGVDRWEVDDSNVVCPMCGSHEVYRA